MFRSLVLPALAALTLLAAPLPAAAGFGGFELPRLDFPAPEAPPTRACQTPAAPAACAAEAR